MDRLPGESIRRVWDKLRDDLSRRIFSLRLQYFLDGCPDRIRDLVMASMKNWIDGNARILNGRKTLLDLCLAPPERRAVLYGAGNFGKQARRLLTLCGVETIRFYDSDAARQGTLCDGVPISGPDALPVEDKPPLVISIHDRNAVETVYSQLLDRGFPPDKLFLMPRMEDGEYFDQNLFPPAKNDVYLDVGSYTTTTIREFIHYQGGKYERIYAMEPDPEQCRQITEEIDRYKLRNVEIIDKGAWSVSGEQPFHSLPGTGVSQFSEAGTAILPVAAIDDLGLELTFIKMDIEGAELQALRGAENTIRRHRPRLAVCVYHKNEDIVDIPCYLNRLVPEYEFHLRHHSLSHLDTVLYAQVRPAPHRGGKNA